MPQPGNPAKIATRCPSCCKTFLAAAAHAGRAASCPACSARFVIEPVARAVPAQPKDARLCGICQSPFLPGETPTSCPACRTPFHGECWEYNGGCGVYGCSQAPPAERLSSLEIPPSYWGREEKPCPKCRQMIVAAAIRCRHCGAVFSSAAPQGAAAYSLQQQVRARIPSVRAGAIRLLIFSFTPCTAPLAALIGLVWYFKNRETLRAMPAVHAALGKIAVGVAAAQTVLLIVVAILVSLAGH